MITAHQTLSWLDLSQQVQTLRGTTAGTIIKDIMITGTGNQSHGETKKKKPIDTMIVPSTVINFKINATTIDV